MQAAFATGQLARHLAIPWRSSMSSTSNAVDAQAAYETAMAMWGSVLGGSNLSLHAAGWMEGGWAHGGHFFGQDHTMKRYETAFYTPLVSDWSNLGRWTETGSRDAAQRANTIWKQVVADLEPPGLTADTEAVLTDFIARRTREGGAPPVS